MSHVALTSPFSCRWIVRGSEARISNWSLAVCERVRVHPRIVTEEECATCALWESPDDPDAARNVPRPRRAA